MNVPKYSFQSLDEALAHAAEKGVSLGARLYGEIGFRRFGWCGKTYCESQGTFSRRQKVNVRSIRQWERELERVGFWTLNRHGKNKYSAREFLFEINPEPEARPKPPKGGSQRPGSMEQTRKAGSGFPASTRKRHAANPEASPPQLQEKEQQQQSEPDSDAETTRVALAVVAALGIDGRALDAARVMFRALPPDRRATAAHALVERAKRDGQRPASWLAAALLGNYAADLLAPQAAVPDPRDEARETLARLRERKGGQ